MGRNIRKRASMPKKNRPRLIIRIDKPKQRQICNQFVAEAKDEKLPGAKRQAIAAIAKRNAILTLHSKLIIMKAQRHYR